MKTLALTLVLTAQATLAAGPACQATSSASPPLVVELYTSEGCSSCPPADRWLSTLKGRPDVLPLAFHVTYWDRLGWPDRFALPEATARQYELARVAGQRNVYTPQVLAGGQDWRHWPALPAAQPAGGPQVTLLREGERVRVQVDAIAAGPAQLSGYWAVLEDGHENAVSAGENAGHTLRHDHVVRLYRPLPPWAASRGFSAELTVSRGVPATPRRVVFVVTDTASRRPVQAAVLGC